ncbi:MAG: transporter substrate-binding domain-containing protein [Clostridia bacterium]|nr:transporter substrate-binding domain-containing protein [Clostridia bacterium]
MKKLLAVLLALAMIFSFAACGSKPAEPAAPADDAEETVKLIVGFDAEFPPYGYVADDGSYDGFDLALAKEACKRLGWEYDELAINWDYKDNNLEAGDITCIWNGFTMTGREGKYAWSEPYVDNSMIVVVKADSDIQSFDDLEGKTFMAQAGSSGLQALQESELGPKVGSIVELPDYMMGFSELDMGTVDAICIDIGVAKYQMAAKGAENYRILDGEVDSEQYAVGFKLGNEEMAAQITKVLHEMADDGTMLEIAKKYEDAGLSVSGLCMID